MQSMKSLITPSQLRWTGNVIRMSENRLPWNLLYSEGSRPRGRPRLCFKDTAERRLGLDGVSHQQPLARDLARSMAHSGKGGRWSGSQRMGGHGG